MLILVALAESVDALLREYVAAPARTDAVELRLDRLTDSDLTPLFKATGKPRIATCRSRAQGGFFGGSEEERRAVLKRAIDLGAEFVDLEFESDDEEILGRTDKSRPLLSYHHRGGTPLNLEAIYRRMAQRSPEAILKLIPYADACSDNLRVRGLLHLARAEGRDLIAFCMGERGKVSRILARAWGSWGVYAPARSESTTAPGQLLLDELEEVFREGELHESSPLTGVLGHPVSGSLSPLLYNRAYRELGLNGCFLPIDAEGVAEFLPLLSDLPITGLAVTHPHKQSFATHCDELEPAAGAVGAVNTVVRRWNRLVGYNTDIEGALRPLSALMDLRGAKVGILGCGGSATAAAYGLTRAGARVILFGRNPQPSEAAAARAGCTAQTWDKASSFRGDVLINATPVGMAPSPAESPLSWEKARAEIAFDFVYNPRVTAFLREARLAGARILTGDSMFLEQALLQFEILTGRAAPRALFEEILSSQLQGNDS
ncbi:MAG: type I 3-dehydroquinate dehydratase [Acidobacteria bacterium]|nr:type I 3-dehydroquinate dehydratase [Acidobacteriota bacterium]